MKIRKGPQSGKQGNIVASHNHFGPYERALGSSTKDPSPAQQSSQAQFGFVARAWINITEEQRLAWIEQARHAKSQSRLGQSWPLTGQTYFMQVNNARLSFGLCLLTDPPPLARPGRNPVGGLFITNRGGRITLKLQLSELPTAAIMVFGAAPCSRGISKCFKCPRLGLLPDPQDGLCDITLLYVQKYGWPKAGQRIFIRTCQQNDSRPDHYLEVNAIVPDSHTRGSRSKKP